MPDHARQRIRQIIKRKYKDTKFYPLLLSEPVAICKERRPQMTMNKKITRQMAGRYIGQNLSIIPAKRDKTPALGSWRPYQSKQMTQQEIYKNFPAEAVAIITGYMNLEVIDVDIKHDKTGNLWPELWSLINDNLPDIAPGLVIASTQSGGKHIYYRCQEAAGNLKLATNSENETLIETRGKGGYVIAPPSPGYCFDNGCSLENIPGITPEHRETLLAVCRSFNKVDEVPSEPPQPTAKGKNNNPVKYEGLSPFEDYDSRGDITGLLERHGWQKVKEQGDRIHFLRPGETTAKTSANFHIGKNRFYCFTTSSQFEAGKGYSPTAVFALLECNNDLSDASRRLCAEGYGDRHNKPENSIDNSLMVPDQEAIFTGTREQQRVTPAPSEWQSKNSDTTGTKIFEISLREGMTESIKPDPEDIDAILQMAEIKPDEDIAEPEVCLSIVEGQKEAVIGTLGNFSLIIGKAKSRKTFFVTIALAAAAKNNLIFDRIAGKLPPGKNTVLFIDTEQARHHVLKAYKRVLGLSGIQPDQTFKAFCLRKNRPDKRLQLVEHLVYNTPGLGMVVIDGIRDLVTSINDEEQATKMASDLLKWTEERSIHIICVLHQNKNDQNARGHLGTELQNKAETVLSVTKDNENKDISIVEAEYCREREPEPFAFEIDGYGLPRLVEDWHPVNSTRQGKKSVTPNDFEMEYHLKILKHLFIENHQPKRGELISAIKSAFKTKGIDFGDNKARDFLNHYTRSGIIKKEGIDGSPKAFYELITE